MTLPLDKKPTHCCLYWDYYGSSARGTAEHFLSHLKTWLIEQKLFDHSQGLEVEIVSPNHVSVSCQLPMKEGALVYRTLKAHRALAMPLIEKDH
jgi:hypothetical protein